MPIRAAATIILILILAAAAVAQEPRAAHLTGSLFADPEGVAMSLPWRYAPGDGAGREAVAFDDSRWQIVRPELTRPDLPESQWQGVGWFRRHIVLDPALQAQTLSIRMSAPGIADVFVDGRLVLATGRNAAPPEVPGTRSDAVLVRMPGPSHVIAVRYVYPRAATSKAGDGFGFALSIANHPRPLRTGELPTWPIGVRGAIVAVPLFLALLHFALYAFNRRARENLFYAVEMLTFGVLVLREYRNFLIANEAARRMLDRAGNGLPPIAILFAILTYYALRTKPFPRTSRVFVAAAVVLFVLTFVNPWIGEYGWIAYFLALLVEVVRIERRPDLVKREGSNFFLASFMIFGCTVVLQILVNLRIVDAIAGLREIYIVGILASAVGMSLFLARTLGQSHLMEAEHARKTHELAQARALQLSMLPRAMPDAPGLQVAASTQPAAEVGGDYYDVRATGDGALLFAFGDATGHGLSAGIVVTAAKALFTSLDATAPLPELLGKCDEVMRAMQLPMLRMCLALARVSRTELSVAMAAMPPLLVYRAATGEIEELGRGGLPLGTRLAGSYVEETLTLAPGDTILFASDGFAELTNAEGAQLGYGGATEAFREACGVSTSAEQVIEQLSRTESAFRGSRAPDDDVTWVVVRVKR